MPTRRHILHLMASGAAGGGADHLVHLLPALRSLGWSCSAAVGSGGLAQRLRQQGLTVVGLDLMHSRLSFSSARRLQRQVEGLRPQILHLHGTRAGFYGAWAGAWARLQGAFWPQVVYTVHGLAYRKLRGRVGHGLDLAAEAAACRAHQVVSVSRTDLDDLRRRGFLPGPGIHLGNAVDAVRFCPGDKQAARRHLQLPQSVPLIGSTSRLVRQKAVHDLLDAALLLPCVALSPGAPARLPEVVVLGEGPLRAALAAHPLARAGRLHLLGNRDDVAACLPAFDLFALSSHWEGEPIALLEAMACGLPCVATATGGAQELLADGSGLLCRIGDPADLRACLVQLLESAERRQQLAAAARQGVAGRSYAGLARRLSAVYADLGGVPSPLPEAA
jgi:glycosyltransferase involved in cell wall biosynthesis